MDNFLLILINSYFGSFTHQTHQWIFFSIELFNMYKIVLVKPWIFVLNIRHTNTSFCGSPLRTSVLILLLSILAYCGPQWTIGRLANLFMQSVEISGKTRNLVFKNKTEVVSPRALFSRGRTPSLWESLFSTHDSGPSKSTPLEKVCLLHQFHHTDNHLHCYCCWGFQQ